jgi:hypothetical protein
MSNKDAENPSDAGEGKKFEDESKEKELPRDASGEHAFDEDTEEAIRLPKVKPEVTEDDDADKKKADSAFDDLEIEIDENELKAESEGQTPGRRY